MAVSYSRDDGVGAGIAKTFDGQHMCSLCKEIAKKREGEQKDLGGGTSFLEPLLRPPIAT
jgi:hypothetical protein